MWDVGHCDAGHLFNVREDLDSHCLEYLLGDKPGGNYGACVPATEYPRPYGVVGGAVLDERGIGRMTGTRRAVGVLILLDMDKMPVEVGYENRQRCAVGLIPVARSIDSVRGVEPGKDDGRSGSFLGEESSSAPGLRSRRSP